MRVHVNIEKDEAGYFTAEVPALPGCLSQGKTYDEALANIKEAIEAWFEVMEAKASLNASHLVEVTVSNLKLVSGAEAVRKLQKAGWTVMRQKGSHVMLTKAG